MHIISGTVDLILTQLSEIKHLTAVYKYLKWHWIAEGGSTIKGQQRWHIFSWQADMDFTNCRGHHVYCCCLVDGAAITIFFCLFSKVGFIFLQQITFVKANRKCYIVPLHCNKVRMLRNLYVNVHWCHLFRFPYGSYHIKILKTFVTHSYCGNSNCSLL